MSCLLTNHRFHNSYPCVLRDVPSVVWVIVDRIRPVLQRTKPSSRTILIDEQSNPCHLLQQQVMMSRHRGADHSKQYELFWSTNLLSLE